MVKPQGKRSKVRNAFSRLTDTRTAKIVRHTHKRPFYLCMTYIVSLNSSKKIFRIYCGTSLHAGIEIFTCRSCYIFHHLYFFRVFNFCSITVSITQPFLDGFTYRSRKWRSSSLWSSHRKWCQHWGLGWKLFYRNIRLNFYLLLRI